LVDGIAAILEVRFGAAGVALMDAIQPIGDMSTLEQLLQAAKIARTLGEVRAIVTSPNI
jgi:hypothetical protein